MKKFTTSLLLVLGLILIVSDNDRPAANLSTFAAGVACWIAGAKIAERVPETPEDRM